MRKVIYILEEDYISDEDNYLGYELNGNKEEIKECLAYLAITDNTRRINDIFITENLNKLKDKIVSYDYDESREANKRAVLNSRLSLIEDKKAREEYLENFPIHNIYIKEFRIKSGRRELFNLINKIQ